VKTIIVNVIDGALERPETEEGAPGKDNKEQEDNKRRQEHFLGQFQIIEEFNHRTTSNIFSVRVTDNSGVMIFCNKRAKA
jgi:hypothetical protein